jgi:hypothetical protein
MLDLLCANGGHCLAHDRLVLSGSVAPVRIVLFVHSSDGRFIDERGTCLSLSQERREKDHDGELEETATHGKPPNAAMVPTRTAQVCGFSETIATSA